MKYSKRRLDEIKRTRNNYPDKDKEIDEDKYYEKKTEKRMEE